NADHIGFEAKAPGDIATDMCMGVDHSWQDQLAAHINNLPRRRRQDVLADERDFAAGDGDVHDAVDAGHRTDDMTALQDKVVDRGCVHGWLPLLNRSSAGSPMPR